MLADATATGACPIEVPHGDASALADASAAWRDFGHGLAMSASRVRESAATASAAGGLWSGAAAQAFTGYTEGFSGVVTSAAEGCQDAAVAVRVFGHALHEAQQDAKRAIRDYEQAEGVRRSASASAVREGRDAEGQRAAASRSRAAASDARAVPGAVGEHAARGHELDAQKSEALSAAAGAAARHASARAAAAEREQQHAIASGEKANRQANDAAEAAAAAFSHAEGLFRSPPDLGIPPVPVTATDDRPVPFGPAAPIAGSPFKGRTPGDVRREQIAKQKQAIAGAEKVPKGSIADGLGAGVDSATGVNVGGDRDTRRAAGGAIAGLIVPLPVGKLKVAAKAARAAQKARREARDAARAEQVGREKFNEVRATHGKGKARTERVRARNAERKRLEVARASAKQEIVIDALKRSAEELARHIGRYGDAIQAEYYAQMLKTYLANRQYMNAGVRSEIEAALEIIRKGMKQ